AEEAEQKRMHPDRTPREICDANPVISRAVESIADGSFSYGDTELFRPIVESLLSTGDPYLLLHDLEDYLRCQEQIGRAYQDKKSWTRKSILNVTRMGKFSSDRTIKEYAEEIWGVPVH
ncbi:MAG: glycogen/starch/alpha-glucan phosphorylase, partial [Desulfobulbaceae bacterium]|nr:glycogen/starch/alpha-glucan phosphorylase [Desulfobulbaceae bacterium]